LARILTDRHPPEPSVRGGAKSLGRSGGRSRVRAGSGWVFSGHPHIVAWRHTPQRRLSRLPCSRPLEGAATDLFVGWQAA